VFMTTSVNQAVLDELSNTIALQKDISALWRIRVCHFSIGTGPARDVIL